MVRTASSVTVVVLAHERAEAFGMQSQREAVVPQAAILTPADMRALLRIPPQAAAPAHAAGLAWEQRVFQDSVNRHADELRARGLKF